MVVYTTAVSDITYDTEIATALDALGGTDANEERLFLVGNGTDSTLWEWDDNNGDGSITAGELTLQANLTGVDQTTVTADNFADFTAANNIVSVSGTQNVALTAQNDIITGSSGDDTITLTTQGAASGDTVDLAGDDDSLILGNFTNVITVSNTETITGNAGADTVTVATQLTGALVSLAGGADSLVLGDFTNSLTLRDTETFTGGDSQDTVTLSSTLSTGNTYDGAVGNDVLNLFTGNNTASITNFETINGGSGNDDLVLEAAISGATIDLAGSASDFNYPRRLHQFHHRTQHRNRHRR